MNKDKRKKRAKEKAKEIRIKRFTKTKIEKLVNNKPKRYKIPRSPIAKS